MNRQKINRVSGTTPVAMSLMALLVVLIAVSTGWERNLTDEGTAAHIFQLLIVLQVPIILLFLVTADWKHFEQVARRLAFQVLAVGLAFAPVAFFKL